MTVPKTAPPRAASSPPSVPCVSPLPSAHSPQTRVTPAKPPAHYPAPRELSHASLPATVSRNSDDDVAHTPASCSFPFTDLGTSVNDGNPNARISDVNTDTRVCGALSDPRAYDERSNTSQPVFSGVLHPTENSNCPKPRAKQTTPTPRATDLSVSTLAEGEYLNARANDSAAHTHQDALFSVPGDRVAIASARGTQGDGTVEARHKPQRQGAASDHEVAELDVLDISGEARDAMSKRKRSISAETDRPHFAKQSRGELSLRLEAQGNRAEVRDDGDGARVAVETRQKGVELHGSGGPHEARGGDSLRTGREQLGGHAPRGAHVSQSEVGSLAAEDARLSYDVATGKQASAAVGNPPRNGASKGQESSGHRDHVAAAACRGSGEFVTNTSSIQRATGGVAPALTSPKRTLMFRSKSSPPLQQPYSTCINPFQPTAANPPSATSHEPPQARDLVDWVATEQLTRAGHTHGRHVQGDGEVDVADQGPRGGTWDGTRCEGAGHAAQRRGPLGWKGGRSSTGGGSISQEQYGYKCFHGRRTNDAGRRETTRVTQRPGLFPVPSSVTNMLVATSSAPAPSAQLCYTQNQARGAVATQMTSSSSQSLRVSATQSSQQGLEEYPLKQQYARPPLPTVPPPLPPTGHKPASSVRPPQPPSASHQRIQFAHRAAMSHLWQDAWKSAPRGLSRPQQPFVTAEQKAACQPHAPANRCLGISRATQPPPPPLEQVVSKGEGSGQLPSNFQQTHPRSGSGQGEGGEKVSSSGQQGAALEWGPQVDGVQKQVGSGELQIPDRQPPRPFSSLSAGGVSYREAGTGQWPYNEAQPIQQAIRGFQRIIDGILLKPQAPPQHGLARKSCSDAGRVTSAVHKKSGRRVLSGKAPASRRDPSRKPHRSNFSDGLLMLSLVAEQQQIREGLEQHKNGAGAAQPSAKPQISTPAPLPPLATRQSRKVPPPRSHSARSPVVAQYATEGSVPRGRGRPRKQRETTGSESGPDGGEGDDNARVQMDQARDGRKRCRLRETDQAEERQQNSRREQTTSEQPQPPAAEGTSSGVVLPIRDRDPWQQVHPLDIPAATDWNIPQLIQAFLTGAKASSKGASEITLQNIHGILNGPNLPKLLPPGVDIQALRNARSASEMYYILQKSFPQGGPQLLAPLPGVCFPAFTSHLPPHSTHPHPVHAPSTSSQLLPPLPNHLSLHSSKKRRLTFAHASPRPTTSAPPAPPCPGATTAAAPLRRKFRALWNNTLAAAPGTQLSPPPPGLLSLSQKLITDGTNPQRQRSVLVGGIFVRIVSRGGELTRQVQEECAEAPMIGHWSVRSTLWGSTERVERFVEQATSSLLNGQGKGFMLPQVRQCRGMPGAKGAGLANTVGTATGTVSAHAAAVRNANQQSSRQPEVQVDYKSPKVDISHVSEPKGTEFAVLAGALIAGRYTVDGGQSKEEEGVNFGGLYGKQDVGGGIDGGGGQAGEGAVSKGGKERKECGELGAEKDLQPCGAGAERGVQSIEYERGRVNRVSLGAVEQSSISRYVELPYIGTRQQTFAEEVQLKS